MALALLMGLLVSGVAAPPAAAAGPPLIWAPWASATDASTTELRATIDPQGTPASYRFEYGPTEAYGSTTTPGSTPADGATDVQATLSGLTPGATYHYRLVATNGAGTAEGDDQVFVAGDGFIPAIDPWATIEAADSARIDIDIESPGGDATWWVEYGTTPGYGSTTPVRTVPGDARTTVTETLTGLTPGQRLHFRVVATNAHGTRVGEDLEFTAGTGFIPAARAYRADLTSVTSAELSGGIEPNGEETRYHFEYGLTDAYGQTTPVRTVPAGRAFAYASESIAGLEKGRTYHFRLVAESRLATVRTADRTFVTEHRPEAAATRPSVTSPTTATLRGRVDSYGDATTYRFEYGATPAYGSETPVRHIAAGASRVDEPISGLTPGARYHVRLVATNATGTTTSEDRRFVAGAPSSSTAAADPVGATGAILRGDVGPNGSATTVHFEWGPTAAYGSSTAGQGIGSGFEQEGVSAELTGLVAGGRYHYRVVATNEAGTVVRGDDQTFVAGAPSTSGTQAVVTSGSTASVTATVNPHGLPTTYRFEYGTYELDLDNATSARTVEATGDAPHPVAAELSGLTPGETYHVRVTATNAAGTGEDRLTTFVAGRAVAGIVGASRVTADAATVGGTVTPSGQETTYHFEYGTTSIDEFRTEEQAVGSGIAPRDVSARLTGLITGAEYRVRLVATNASGVTRTRGRTFTPSGGATAREFGADTTSPTTATFFGTVDGRGTETDYWFEYGPTPDLGSRTAAQTLASDAGVTDVAADAEGLTADRMYYYRLVARNADGTVSGTGARFIMQPRPTVATLAADTLTSTGARVRGDVDAHGHPTAYRFEYATEEQYAAHGTYSARTAWVAIGDGRSPQAVDATLTGLLPDTTYRVRLVASGSAGHSPGAAATFTTRPAPVVPVPPSEQPPSDALPTPHTSLVPDAGRPSGGDTGSGTKQPAGSGPVVVRDPLAPTWLVDGKPVAAPRTPQVRSLPGHVRLVLKPVKAKGVVAYRVYRRVAGSRAPAKVVRTVKKAGTVVDRSVKAGVRYEYVVVAVDRGGRQSKPSKAVRVSVKKPRR